MLKAIESVSKWFQPPPAEVRAVKQLEEAKNFLLDAYAYQEDANAMVLKYQDRIKRLSEKVRNMGKQHDE